MLKIFNEEGSKNGPQYNLSILASGQLTSRTLQSFFVFQKGNYIHNNPVEPGIVEKTWIIYTPDKRLSCNKEMWIV